MADRYLLESGAPDGYLLEDGSGVLLLEGVSLETITRDAQAPVDYATGVLPRSARVSAEYAAVGRAFGGSLSAISEAPISALPEVQQVEQLARDAQVPLDLVGLAQREAQVPLDVVGSVPRDAQLPLDFGVLETVARGAQVPAELGGLAQVFRDSNLPVEWLGTVAPAVEGNWVALVGAAVWGPSRHSWREIPTPTGYERRPAEPERRLVRRRRRKAVPVAESEVVVTAINEEALRRSRAMIRHYRRQLARLEAQQQDEDALLLLL